MGMATGWAIASGEPAFVLLHTTAGLGNAVGALATARVNRAPLVVLVGQQDRRHLAEEPFLAGRLEGLAGEYPVWVHSRPAQDVPGAVTRAWHEAKTARGPAIVIVPMDDWLAPRRRRRSAPPRRCGPRAAVADAAAVQALGALLAARSPGARRRRGGRRAGHLGRPRRPGREARLPRLAGVVRCARGLPAGPSALRRAPPAGRSAAARTPRPARFRPGRRRARLPPVPVRAGSFRRPGHDEWRSSRKIPRRRTAAQR